MGPRATIGERANAEIRSVLVDAGAIRNQMNRRRNVTRSIWLLDVRNVSDRRQLRAVAALDFGLHLCACK
jgi:hypothetical protein